MKNSLNLVFTFLFILQTGTIYSQEFIDYIQELKDDNIKVIAYLDTLPIETFDQSFERNIIEQFENLFQRPVDLVTEKSLSNPFFNLSKCFICFIFIKDIYV